MHTRRDQATPDERFENLRVRVEVRATARGRRPHRGPGWRALTAGVVGFVVGVGFWHAIGFWSFLAEVVATGRPSDAQPIVRAARIVRQVAGTATPANAAPAPHPACIALSRDPSTEQVRRQPCQPSSASASVEASPRTDPASRPDPDMPDPGVPDTGAPSRIVVDWSRTVISVGD